MKKSIYSIILSKKKEDGSTVFEEDLQYFEEDFSISRERCQEICEKMGLESISFLKIGTADFITDFDELSEERVHYEVTKNELQK